jgi:hypothetical protein
MAESRAAIRLDLKRRRRLDIEAKALRSRLDQLAVESSALSRAAIAQKHGVALGAVLAIAKGMGWTEEEKPPQGPLPPYDAYHDG